MANPACYLSISHRRPRRTRPIGLYFETTSQIDGSPIVVIFTGLERPSANDKTGAMIQVWILRADCDPLDAVSCASDDAICGDCKHRWSLDGACYVNLPKAPLAIYWAWKHGAYAPIDLDNPEHVALLRKRPLRLGAYGDPAAVEIAFWSDLFRVVRPASWTGYTHQWRTTPELRPYVMASVDSEQEYREAQSLGWRTFRCKEEGSPLLPGERHCPASINVDFQCFDCGCCNGTSRVAPSYAIDVHGVRASRFVSLSEPTRRIA